MSIVHVMDHPLIQHKLSLMRDQETGPKEFRELLNEISMLMAYEVTRDLPLKTIEIETPICRAQTQVIAGKKLAIVPILRAGLGMVDGIMSLVPAAKVGHIGLYRDEETLKPMTYYFKLPVDTADGPVVVVDPALATGGSADAAATIHAMDALFCLGLSLEEKQKMEQKMKNKKVPDPSKRHRLS